ncbi:MAG: SulP family inorganic anion transporter [Acidobacteriota bacterium]|nr:SulP family inorganic anion transporter [Acidobacteriota bacterium]
MTSLRNTNWRAFAGDISGGFIASLIAFPYGLAMASAMGLPPILGIFTSILTAPITALLGRNPVMIGGASSVTIPFIAVAVRVQGIGGAAKVSIVAAVLMLVFSTLRLGRYVAKVPHAVMAGFSCGIGGMMVISQLRTILGLKAVPGSADLSMAGQLGEVLVGLGDMQWTTAITATIVVIVAALSTKASHRLPAPLLGIGAAILIANAFGWRSTEVGWLASSIPPFAGFRWEPSDVYTVLPAAFGLAFVTSVNLLVTSRVVEHFRGRHRHLKKSDADRELGAYGIANLASGIFGAPMSVGIPARSLANVQCGGVSRLSNTAHAAFLLLFVVEGARFIAHIPLAALAAVTAWMGVRLMEWSTWRRLPKMRRVDAAAFLATALSALFLNAVFAVALGCFIYALNSLLTPQLLRQIGLTVNIGKTEIPSLKTVGQSGVVDSQ